MLNINVGVLGHVDSGKTSLCKALSTIASTAAFDNNPQSQARGITLDLGFSSFYRRTPDHLKTLCGTEPEIQFTLVDCPGHASLIKTIIGGAQIIDVMLLVVDINKGIQAQTAECIVVGEITCSRMVVVLNKIDMIPIEKRQQKVAKMTAGLMKALQSTRFKNVSVISAAAVPGGDSLGLDDLIEALESSLIALKRPKSDSFLFSIDHCFGIKGQGTVMTGTVLGGSIKPGDSVEIPSMKIVKKVKSLQMFRRTVDGLTQGDRGAMLVTQFDAKSLERGYACTENAIPTARSLICNANRVRIYKGELKSGSKFHISVGHQTVMAEAQFFSLVGTGVNKELLDSFTFDRDYLHLPTYSSENTAENRESTEVKDVYCLLLLEQPLLCPPDSVYIASRLDIDINSKAVRLAFHGKILYPITSANYKTEILPKLRVYKKKFREGTVDRMVNANSIVGKGLFKKETNIQLFKGMKVVLSTGEAGFIDGAFGQSGKYTIQIPTGLTDETIVALEGKTKKSNCPERTKNPVTVRLEFKRYVYDADKRMIQT
eukprot:CFRG5262T1